MSTRSGCLNVHQKIMKTKILKLILVLLGSITAFAETDPFKPTDRPSWKIAAQKEKPYTFELIYGETTNRLSSKGLTAGGVSLIQITDEFNEQAEKIKIGIKEEDTNIFEGMKGEKIILKSKKEGAGFTVQIFCSIDFSLAPGTSGTANMTINSSMLLDEEWLVTEGYSQSTSTANDGTKTIGETVYKYLGMRIYKNKSEQKVGENASRPTP